MRELTNQQLKLERIPDPDGDLRKWEMFAHTINGYEAAGSDEACAALYHDKSATTLTELRCALFFTARADRHGAGGPYDYSPKAMDLLKRIRAKVAAGELD
jgi:hypothetical protein